MLFVSKFYFIHTHLASVMQSNTKIQCPWCIVTLIERRYKIDSLPAISYLIFILFYKKTTETGQKILEHEIPQQTDNY